MKAPSIVFIYFAQSSLEIRVPNGAALHCKIARWARFLSLLLLLHGYPRTGAFMIFLSVLPEATRCSLTVPQQAACTARELPWLSEYEINKGTKAPNILSAELLIRLRSLSWHLLQLFTYDGKCLFNSENAGEYLSSSEAILPLRKRKKRKKAKALRITCAIQLFGSDAFSSLSRPERCGPPDKSRATFSSRKTKRSTDTIQSRDMFSYVIHSISLVRQD